MRARLPSGLAVPSALLSRAGHATPLSSYALTVSAWRASQLSPAPRCQRSGGTANRQGTWVSGSVRFMLRVGGRGFRRPCLVSASGRSSRRGLTSHAREETFTLLVYKCCPERWCHGRHGRSRDGWACGSTGREFTPSASEVSLNL